MAVILPILTTFNAAGVRAAQKELTQLGGALSKIGKSAAAAAVAYKALNGAIDFIGDTVTAARDLERNTAALNTVFGELAPRMQQFSKNAASMGLSQVEAARTSTFLGSVLKQAGFPMDEVADKTEKLTKLAQDLATTYGYDTSEALTAMTALFRGEYDPIEKFGVALKQNEVNALVAAKGLGKLQGQELLNAQQEVRMEQLFKRSADAMGAYERQAGTLFVAQKNLTAAFANMQAVAGGPLTNDLASVFNTITPFITQAGPMFEEMFAAIGDIMLALEPLVAPVADTFFILGEAVTQIAVLFERVLSPLMGPLADALNVVNQALHFVLDVLNALMPLLEIMIGGSLEMLALAWDAVAAALEGVLDFLKPVTDGIKQFFGQFFPYLDKATNDGIDAIRRMRKELRGESTLVFNTDSQSAIAAAVAGFDPTGGKGGGGGTGKKKKDAVKEFYKELADQIKQESATLKLRTLGASEDFIQSIVGSGEDWEKVFKNVTKQGATGIQRLQAQFNRTSAGKAEVYKKLEEAAKAAHEAAMEQYRKDLEVFNEQKRLFDAQVAAIANFKDAITSITETLQPLAILTREIGQYEQAAIDAFTNIASTVKDALKEGTLTKTAAEELNKYANAEKDALVRIGMERDKVANKRSLAQSVLQDVKDAIVGIGNITSLIEKQTKQVTVSITKMVGNLKVTTSRTIDEVTNTGGLVGSFKNILDKTRNFATQLKELRKLGLDQNLYKQIVDAGIDAGSTTAEEIIKGGAGTVTELNNLFTELNSTGASIAEETAQVMYGAGVNITDGIIAGLVSQEQLLVDQAKKMADAFITAFNEKMATMVVPTVSVPNMPSEPVYVPPVMPQTQQVQYTLAELKNINLATVTSDAEWKKNAALAAKLIATPEYKKSNVITVNVSTAVGTNGKTVGKAIQAELNKYLKATSK